MTTGLCQSSLILSLILFSTTFGISLAETAESTRLSKLECARHCYTRARKCAALPNVCGDCASNHVEVDGVCRARTMNVAEQDFDIQEALQSEIVRERRKLDTLEDNALPNGNTAAVDKDNTIETNAAAASADRPAAAAMSFDRRQQSQPAESQGTDVIIIAVIAALCSAAVVGIVVALICYCLMRRSVKDVSEAGDSYPEKNKLNDDYPAYPPVVDRKLAQSAQMYHYQHQKQQMLELERAQEYATKSDGEGSTDEDNVDDQYTVYECPGLANTGEMEVGNPLYSESPLPPGSPPPPPPSSTPPPLSTVETTGQLVNGHK